AEGAGDGPGCRAGGAQQPHRGLHRPRARGGESRQAGAARGGGAGGTGGRGGRGGGELAAKGRDPLSGRLRLGVIPTIAPYLLPKTLPVLRKAYPKLQLYLTEDQTGRLLGLLEDGTLDLVLLALAYHAEHVETLPLFKDGFPLGGGKDSPRAKKTPATPASLKVAALLLRGEGHCLREHARAACRFPKADSGFS